MEVIQQDETTRKRFVGPLAEHLCPAKTAARAAEFERQMREPHPGEVARIRRECGLPPGSPCGLAALDEDEDNHEAMAAARQFLANFQAGKRSDWLVFYGPVGVGKSTLSKALAFDIAHKTGAKMLAGEHRPRVNWGPQASALWLNMPSFFEDLKRGFGGGNSRVDVDRMRRAHCLFFDEFLNEQASLWTVDTYARLLNERLEDGRALVLSGNYSPGEFYLGALKAAQRVNASDDDLRVEMKAKGILDRIKEQGRVVEMRGTSRRRVYE
jgi:primosomal protein DnaI